MDRKDSIPVDCSMPWHRKTIEIAKKGGVSRREAVAILIEFWIWANKNADASGFLPRFDTADLNEAVPASPKFWDAVIAAGWLVIEESGLRIPKADKWLSKAKPKKKTGAKGEAVDTSPVVMKFKASGEPPVWNLHESQFALWTGQFPNVEVAAELKSAQAWSDANGHKTAKGMKRFLCAWLERAHNRGKKSNGQKPLISRVPSDDDLKDWRP